VARVGNGARVAHRASDAPFPLMAGVLLGVGLGGFVDGIVFHQILQWHHMLTAVEDYPSGTVRGLEVNTLWDGLFHLLALVFTVAGVVILWRAPKRPLSELGTDLLGPMLMGWGLFNVVEGVVDHLLLRIHHVRDDVVEPLPWDLGFLAAGLLLFFAGWLLVRSARLA
jgi:uncharacterized membrane protein